MKEGPQNRDREKDKGERPSDGENTGKGCFLRKRFIVEFENKEGSDYVDVKVLV